MIRFDRFPGGKTHAVAFSFDDGRSEDARLAKLFDQYALRATFHLNSGRVGREGYLSAAQAVQLSQTHEVALHGENHARLINCPSTVTVQEVLRDRIFLEETVNGILQGFSYPYGDVNESIYHAVAACGVKYARTANSTHCFGLPDDFLLWNPTCHMYEAYRDMPHFLEKLPKLGQAPLFLIWGHSFELERDNGWDEMEKFFREIAGREEIWYASCGDIYSYVQAVRGLRVSADETMVLNPSFQSVWISYDKNPLEICGGECVRLE